MLHTPYLRPHNQRRVKKGHLCFSFTKYCKYTVLLKSSLLIIAYTHSNKLFHRNEVHSKQIYLYLIQFLLYDFISIKPTCNHYKIRCFPDEMVGCIYLLYLKMQELFGEDICILKEPLQVKLTWQHMN